MSLATSCPSCGTVFRVVQDQLKVSEGWVRCGHCQEVFNALEGLFDLSRRDTTTPEPSPDLAVPATSNPNDPAWMETRPAMFSDGKVLRERQEARQHRPLPPASPTRVEISSRRAATWDPSVQEPERGMAPTQPDPGAWRTTSADTSLPVPSLAPEEFLRGTSFEDSVPDSLLADPDFDAAAPSDEIAYPATTLEFRSEAFSAFAAARLRRDGRPDVDLPLDIPTAPAPLTAQATPAPSPLSPSAPESAPGDSAASPSAATASSAELVESASIYTPDLDQSHSEEMEKTLDLSVDLVAAPDEAVVTPLSPSNQATDTVSGEAPLPEFVRRADSQARWHRPIVRASLGAFAVLLASLLVWQTSQHWHDLIAARWPVSRPLLARACKLWQCHLQAPQQLDALVVDSTTLSLRPSAGGYLLGVTLHNRAGHAVAAPHIELSLTDTAGAVVLRRVLSPAEFRQSDTLVAQSDASWNLEFTSTNQRIAGYTLAAFYP
ncbi:MAG: zinc-ribbon domain-containing protein [Sphaerotilus sp.]|nr:zinc-ribbon domain-containing protein [Sphaerotilus sp.]